MIGTYSETLSTSYQRSGSTLCLGIDPIPEYLPAEYQEGNRIADYFESIFELCLKHDTLPAAFKPNIGFFHAIDCPRSGDFSGSAALATILASIRNRFPGIPVILDSKRGDIARSSTNYGQEGFVSWGVDAMTVSPFMGDDSVLAIAQEAGQVGGGLYVLAITSNPGAHRFQSAALTDGGTLTSAVAQAITEWHTDTGCLGAVVGATHPEQRDTMLRTFASADVPLLIPGVGSQGGSGAEVMQAIAAAGYPAALARVNVSSGITHPWKDSGAPSDWREVVSERLMHFHKELSE